MEITKKNICFILLFFSISIIAQTTTIGLIIKEVHLNDKSPNQNWIKVLNTESHVKSLGNLRISHIKTPNVLPQSLKNSEPIELNSGETIILCANIEEYTKHWSDNSRLIQVAALNQLDIGGFIAISKNENELTKYDLLRYGNPAASDRFDKYDVVPFSRNEKIYIRNSINNEGYSKFGNWQ